VFSGICSSEVNSFAVLEVYIEIHHTWVAFVNRKVKDAPDSFVAADVPAHLVMLNLDEAISILYSKRGVVTAFVDVFQNVLDRLDGVTIFDVDVRLLDNSGQ